jgi:hypothetical protein
VTVIEVIVGAVFGCGAGGVVGDDPPPQALSVTARVTTVATRACIGASLRFADKLTHVPTT